MYKALSRNEVEQKRDTRLVSSSAVRARSLALLYERAVRATLTGYIGLMLAGTFQHRAGLLDARDRRIGAGAARAVIHVKLAARFVQMRTEHARTFRRRHVFCGACVGQNETCVESLSSHLLRLYSSEILVLYINYSY